MILILQKKGRARRHVPTRHYLHSFSAASLALAIFTPPLKESSESFAFPFPKVPVKRRLIGPPCTGDSIFKGKAVLISPEYVETIAVNPGASGWILIST